MPRSRRVVLTFLAAALAIGGLTASPAAAATISVAKTSGSSFAEDAPDPFILKYNEKFYAYTTGTSWGNHIGILKSDTATGKYKTLTGQPWGSSVFPSVHYSSAPAAWQVPGTQVAPGVVRRNGRWILYYSAKRRSTGEWCLSIATASSPIGPFVDRTGNTPWFCMDNHGGAVDPSPYVGRSSSVWLLFKTNTGSRSMSARLWITQLNSSGTKRVGSPKVLLEQNSARYSWETTIENPHMVMRSGKRYLFYSGNAWNSNKYAMNYALCDRVDGGCHRLRSTPFLTSYGNVRGPGGGVAFTNGVGDWWLTYHGWGSCVSYSCGGKRKLYAKALKF